MGPSEGACQGLKGERAGKAGAELLQPTLSLTVVRPFSVLWAGGADFHSLSSRPPPMLCCKPPSGLIPAPKVILNLLSLTPGNTSSKLSISGAVSGGAPQETSSQGQFRVQDRVCHGCKMPGILCFSLKCGLLPKA